MITQIFILCAFTFALWWSFQKGEIFGIVQSLFASLSPVIKKPLFDCAVCMHLWWGTLFYWLLFRNPFTASDWKQWIITIVAGIGVNAVIVKWWPCCNE